MAAGWFAKITGRTEERKRWHVYKERKAQLPQSHRTAIDGIERYLMYSGTMVKGDVMMRMFEDLADLIEGAAVDGTPVRDVVGDDPVEFADTFMQNYAEGRWIAKERQRLNDAIDEASELPAREPGSRRGHTA